MIYLLIAFIVFISIAYGLVYWAYRAETDRSAYVGLFLVYGFPGILLTVAGLAYTFNGHSRGPVLLAIGLGLTLPLLKGFRVFLSRFTPIDPASRTDMSGLCVFLGILGFLIISAIEAPEPDAVQGSVSAGELVAQMLAFVALAYTVVGLGFRRTFAQATTRLGVRKPTVKVVLIGFGFVLVAFFVSSFASVFTALFQPDVSDQIQRGLEEMTTDVQSPAGAALLGLSAGVGEELLFRGALQPRFGIILTSLCFALIHTNYGVSFITLGVFGLGMVFGWMRIRYGTVAPMITHAIFNLIAVLLQSAT